MTKYDEMQGVDPVSKLSEHKDFMRVNHPTHKLHSAKSNGYLNIKTGLFVAPIIAPLGFFSPKHRYTGEASLIWDTTKTVCNSFTLSESEVAIFLKKTFDE